MPPGISSFSHEHIGIRVHPGKGGGVVVSNVSSSDTVVPSSPEVCNMSLHTTSRDGIRLAYALEKGGPVDVVLVCGAGASAEWEFFSRLLPKSVFSVLTFHARGTGDSGTPPSIEDMRVDQLVDDVISVADAAGFSSFHVVGHSMGGLVAAVVTARHPGRVASAVLIVTAAALHCDA